LASSSESGASASGAQHPVSAVIVGSSFAIAEPPLKLVLLENPGEGGSLNPLGVEVGSTDEVVAATRRFTTEGLETRIEDGTTCCYALQDKVWVTGPSGEPWEVYTVLADAGAELEGKTRADVEGTPNERTRRNRRVLGRGRSHRRGRRAQRLLRQLIR
jgi:hypothetical protein